MFAKIVCASLGLVALLVTPAAGAFDAAAGSSGAVFTMSNSAAGNSVLAWERSANGTLTPAGATSTGGLGSGGPLNNQGGLTLSPDGAWLYAVNAGSDSIAVFRVSGTGLTLTDTEPAHGRKPISVTSHGELVYVLNAGGKGAVRGFRRDADGALTFIDGSSRPLSAARVTPAQIGFNPAGTQLLVTERRTDRITRYRVLASGALGAPLASKSAGDEPFGFEFGPSGTLVVSEAGNHVEDASSASSYALGSGKPRVISAAVRTTETAACWVDVTPNGRFAYITNTPDDSISGFAIADNGSLTLLDAGGRTAAPSAGSLPIDLDSSSDGEFLYVLATGSDRILVYAINSDGSLSEQAGVGGLPGFANGLVAR